MLKIVPNPAKIVYGQTGPVAGRPVSESILGEDVIYRYARRLADSEIRGPVSFFTDPDHVYGPEGYQLSRGPEGACISSGTAAGALYGLQTLRQLTSSERSAVPLFIEDQACYPHRGFMLDCSRHFFPVEDIIKLLDSMSLMKLNRFHWHLTDDQGWRVPIRSYPLLTEVGSVRSYTAVGGRRSRRRQETPHRGSYSPEDISRVLAAARERAIEVIPEVDLPGHVTSAIAAYPELSCSKEPCEVPGTFGIHKRVLCASSVYTREWIATVLDELCELFPGCEFHIGGDEVPTSSWEECPSCQAHMKARGYTHPRELQGELTRWIEAHLSERGVGSIAWNETLTGLKGRPGSVIQFWNPLGGRKRALLKAAGEGAEVIYSGYLDTYLDQRYALLSLRRVYRGGSARLLRSLGPGLLGFEAPLWTEWVPTLEMASFLILPRLAALAERAWSRDDRRAYEDFTKRLETPLSMLHHEGIVAAPRRAWVPRWYHRLSALFHLSDDQRDEVERYR